MAFLTIREILDAAIRIEEDTYAFYREARKVLAGISVEGERLLESLADDEWTHKKILSDFDPGPITKAYINYEPDLSRYHPLLEKKVMPGMSPAEIQKLALKREGYTRIFYISYAEHASAEDLKELLTTLADFEVQHIAKIRLEYGDYYGL